LKEKLKVEIEQKNQRLEEVRKINQGWEAKSREIESLEKKFLD
jgi:hypothetical protein